MQFRQMFAVRSLNLTKPINILCGENAVLVMLKYVVKIVTTIT